MLNNINPDKPRIENTALDNMQREITRGAIQSLGDTANKALGGFGGAIAARALSRGWQEIKDKVTSA